MNGAASRAPHGTRRERRLLGLLCAAVLLCCGGERTARAQGFSVLSPDRAALPEAKTPRRSPPPRERDELAREVDVYLVDQPLERAIEQIASAAGLSARVNDRLEDVNLRHQRLAGPLREVLDRVARSHNLSWFLEGRLLEVSKADSAILKVLRIERIPAAAVRDAIGRYGLHNADRSLELDEANGVARVLAPPRLAARLESVLVALKPPPEDRIETIRFGIAHSPTAAR